MKKTTMAILTSTFCKECIAEVYQCDICKEYLHGKIYCMEDLGNTHLCSEDCLEEQQKEKEAKK